MSSPLPYSDGPRRFSADEVAAELGETLDAVLSSRRTPRAAAESIAALQRAEQNFVLHWARIVARTSAELAFQFSIAAADAVRTLGLDNAEKWVVHAIDEYDREGLYRGTEALRDLSGYGAAGSAAGVSLEEAAPVIRLFVQGLGGRGMSIERAAHHPYTDTERIYLPAIIDRAGTKRENFILYKATAAMLWAQSRYGTFSADLAGAVAGFDDPPRALALLNALETHRLEARITRELPGLARELGAKGDRPDAPQIDRLREDAATVDDSLALLNELYNDPPALFSPIVTSLEPALAERVRAARIARDKAAFQEGLARLAQATSPDEIGDHAPAFALENVGREGEHGTGYTVMLDGKPAVLPADLVEVMASIEHDLGEVPAEYLSGAPSTSADADLELGAGTEPAHVYDEWDYQRRHYRRAWCEVRERPVAPGDTAFVDATTRKYAGRIAQLKRMFELMRGEDRLLRMQADGDELDHDALIDAFVEMSQGAELAPLVFARRKRAERDLAVLFMIDMSGSTKGWINEAEREALIMLCEALESLGDRYAIYGFSGMTRRQCEVYRIKTFDEAYGETVRARIAGIEAQDYTRMGAALRHLTKLLNAVEARTRLLVTLSDGRPDDFSDNYRGEYGVEDTRQALLEAHRSGIKPFCITIDREARDYLPHMYGGVSWTLVQDVAKLPLKIAEIYARLTR